MRFVSVQRVRGGYDLDPRSYLRQLASLAEELPAGARDFAMDPQHYDFSAERCVKDLKLSSVALPGDRDKPAVITFAPSPWKHTAGLTVSYFDVRSLEVRQETPTLFRIGDDVLLDEILPGDGGCTHEIFLTDSVVIVRCADLNAVWESAGHDE